MSAETLLSLRGLRFRYGAREVLAVERLDLAAGETVVLTGDNGSGKTTLLKLLNALLPPAAGEVLYRGAPLGEGGAAAIRRDSVLVHQDPYLFSGSVFHNVAYGLRVRGLAAGGPALQRRVEEALEQVGLAGFAGRRASALSGGERKRVALARALALRPALLLLDEPTANVDAESVQRIEALLRELARDGTTLVLSSHHGGFAYRLADRMIRLDGGRVQPNRENVLKGRVELLDDVFCIFRSGSALLRGPAREGDFTTAVIGLEDLLLSVEPLRSSARNLLEGRVTAVEPEEGHLARVSLDCGCPLQTLITEDSRRAMDVRPGRTFHVAFKASAVRFY